MIPLTLSLRNFLSYGEGVPPLDFTQFRIACLTGDNGHGKSALLDGITYALWGEARKQQGERKADEGLCRIGASEMRVEFDFSLDDDHYRVIRSWRRTKRGIPNLELQISDGDLFRTLSEGQGVVHTQGRINQLLGMDYDTFVNSAFIVQGRADEFTQKNARQRKEILGQILGLGRYDQLQSMARVHYQKHNQQSISHRSRLAELDAELAGRDTYETELRTANERLQTLNGTLAGLEKTQSKLDEQRLQQAQVRQQLAEIAREKERSSERAQQVGKELEYLRDQQRKDREILDAADAIEKDFATHNALRTQVGRLEQKVQARGQLNTRHSELQESIGRARRDVEKRQEKWAAILVERQRQLDELKTLLEQEQTIVVRYAQFKATNEQDQALEQGRIRHEALLHERSQLEHAISLEEQNRKHQLQTLTSDLEKLRRAIREAGDLERNNLRLKTRLVELEDKVAKRDGLKEEGSTLNTQIAERRQQLRAEEEGLANERQQAAGHLDSDAAQCPLCGSSLDEEHRTRVENELAQREEKHKEQITELQKNIANLEEQVHKMREHYQALEEETAPLQKLHRDLAEGAARQKQLQEHSVEEESLATQIATIERALDEGTYTLAERERLLKLAREMAQLGYSAQEHSAQREKLAELRPVETEHTRLQDARDQAARLAREQIEAQEKRDLAASYLAQSRYAQEEQEQLRDIDRQIATLGYDETEHRQLRLQLDDLLASVTKFERLQNAQRRRDSINASLARYEGEATTLAQQLRETEQSEQELSKRDSELVDIDRKLEENQSQLERLRKERDELLQQQGALKTLCARGVEWARERDKLREELKDAQQQIWIYQRLDEAFGKDGIQALIIENAVPQIEKEANAILSQLTDNRIQISFESLRDLKKGGTRETLDVKISDEIGERSYHLYSGGEAFRTDFALRIALSKVLAMRSGTRLRTLFIDEGFGTQDQQGLEQLVEAIQIISRNFDKVLVVTHLEQLKAAFPVQIEVTKHPDLGSRFEIIQHG
jgi:exonuclease SbcC